MEITLRRWQLSDLDNLVKYANNPNIAKNLTDAFPNPYFIEDGKRFIEMANTNPVLIYRAIIVDDSAIGSIGAKLQEDVHRKNAEMGYWLAEPFWGKGIITEAIMRFVDLMFSETEIERIFARPFGTNIASQQVLIKAGFKLEAVFEKTLIKYNEYLDEYVFAIRKGN
jgi:RimJ/RimL family protein N-acetyltransferase